MKNMIKILVALVILTVHFMVTGFEDHTRGRTQIETLYPIVLGGVDKGQDKGNEFVLTTVSPSTEEDAEKPNSVMSVSGRTAFEANRRIGAYAENDIFWGHTKYVLIGHEAAHEDVFKYLEFFIRDNEPRVTIVPIFVHHHSSQELINRLYEQNIDISQTLDRIIQNIPLFSNASTLDLLEFISLASDTKNGYLPCIEFRHESETLRIEQETEEIHVGEYDEMMEQGEIEDDYVMNITGYALIKEGKVVDHLNYDKGRGLSWLLDEIASGVIIIDHEDVRYNLEITHGRSNTRTNIEGDNLSAVVEIQAILDLAEIDSGDVEFSRDLVESLEEKAADAISGETRYALEAIQKHNIDIIGLGDNFHRKYPVKWQKVYEEKWEEIFPEVPVELDIDVRLEKAGKFTDGIIIKGNSQ